MPLHLRQNQYQGVNAHLHSLFQGELGGWESFHLMHISHLVSAVSAELPRGYVVQPERGMQIRRYHPDTGDEIRLGRGRRAKPDISIYQKSPSLAVQPSAAVATAPTLIFSSRDAVEIDPRSYLSAVVIRKIDQERLGDPVTWIELLSPANKPGGAGYVQYQEKRVAAARSGIVMIEIDYLHETESPVLNLASYSDKEEGAFPYTITITDPRPSLKEGFTNVYGMRVDQPLPIAPVPLAMEDAPILLNIEALYHQTYESVNAYEYLVDYEQLPERFDTYMEVDQERIRARMRAVQQAVAEQPSTGDDL